VATHAKAEESRPTVWIELGGQMEAISNGADPFTAPFMSAEPEPESYDDSIFLANQRPAHFSFGLQGRLVLQPHGSDWRFSASILYGRSHTKRHDHKEGEVQHYGYGVGPIFGGHPFAINAAAFADVVAPYSESHTVIDFAAGRDVGIGAVNGNSTISAGVRFAQFSSHSNVGISARPSIGYEIRPLANIPVATFDQYKLQGDTARSFRGIGPSLAWNASAALVGNSDAGEVTFDWGIDAALLFGRQKAKVDHSTHAYHLTQHECVAYRANGACRRYASGYPALYPARDLHNDRSKSVVVPDLGGFAGVSVKYPNAKVSLGYRADFFFGAMDQGIDVRDAETVGFHGPFATISIGLGG
jgi:hypothetical protein